MKQEATNTFGEGIIMDLNPLTTPNNVLTSALNATMITYNGNEFVLQNDMGNGRVETAYLPSGYVPVGIKEYGGIIYVASYNPLTNKGQIGSFPSPERNISSNEIQGAQSVLTPSSFGALSNGILDTFVSKINIFPEGTIIRSGDKFTIMLDASKGSQIDTKILRTYLSNCFNTSSNKPDSPKNKLMTLTLAVSDSNGYLRDITEQLKRFDEDNKTIVFSESDAPLYKTNAGYYIQTVAEDYSSNVDEYRKAYPANVYNNKLSGSLTLIATLNTIDSIDVAVTGYVRPEETDMNIEYEVPNQSGIVMPSGSKYTLIYDLTYKYNCPDGYYEDNKPYNYDEVIEYYNSYYGEAKDFGSHQNVIQGCEFFMIDSSKATLQGHVNFDNSDKAPVYSLESKQYTREQAVQVNLSDVTGNLISYTVTPCMTYSRLQGLSINGAIDLSKIGSGIIQLNTWRYYYNDMSIILTWGLEAYLVEGTSINEIKFKFYRFPDGRPDMPTSEYVVPAKRNYNGVFTEVLRFGDVLEPNNIYLVEIQKTITKGNVTEVDPDSEFRWLVASPLYNEAYIDNTQLDYNRFDDTLIKKYNSLQLDTTYSNTYTRKVGALVKDGADLFPLSNRPLSEFDVKAVTLYNYSYTMIESHKIATEAKYPFELSVSSIDTKYLVDSDEARTTHEDYFLEGNGAKPDDYIVDSDFERLPLVEARPDYNSHKYSIEVEGDKIGVNGAVISELVAAKDPTPKPITYSNIYKSFVSDMSQVFGTNMNKKSTGAYYSSSEFGVHVYSNNKRRRIYLDTINRYSPTGEPSSINSQIYTDKNSGTRQDFRNYWDNFMGAVWSAFKRYPPCVIFGTISEFNNKGYKYPGSQDATHVGGLVSDKSLGSFQMLLWYTGTTYAWVKDFAYRNPGESGGDSLFINNEMANIVYETFRDVYIQTSDSTVQSYWIYNPNDYLYNPDVKITLAYDVSCKRNISTKSLLQVNGNDVNTTSISDFLDLFKIEDKESYINLMTFYVKSDSGYNKVDGTTYESTIPYTLSTPMTALSMESVYAELDKNAKSDSVSSNVGVLSRDDTFFILDGTGNPFIGGRIYYGEAVDRIIPIEQSTTGAAKVRNLKLKDGTLLVNSTSATTKDFAVYRDSFGDSDISVHFAGFPVVEIELDKGSGNNWGTLS